MEQRVNVINMVHCALGVCVCVYVCARVYALRIDSVDRILHITNSFIIIINY